MAHKTISLANAQPGMQLALNVCSADGGVLLAAGSVLSEAALGALARRGVAQLDVMEALSLEQRALRIAEFDQRLGVLFRHVGHDPLLNKLREIVREHRMEGL